MSTKGNQKLQKRDQRIIEEIRKGDPMGLVGELYNSEFPKIRSYIVNNSGTDDDARDVFQETLMTLFSHIKLGKYKEEYEIGGFMYVVAMNQWKRKNKNRPIHVDISTTQVYDISENETYSALFDDEKKDFVNALFDQLGDTCKKLLTHSIFEKISMKELCKKMGYGSVDSTKTKHYKCKQRLIKLVEAKPHIIHYLKNDFNS